MILLCSLINLHAQSLPVACTESRVRYAATPDPVFTHSSFKWFIDAGAYSDTLVYAFGDSIDIRWGKKSGIFRVGVNEISENGCIGDTSWSYVQVQGSVLNIGKDQEHCFGDSVHFDAGQGYISYLWNDTLQSRTFNSVAIKTDTVWVVAVNKNHCRSSDTAIITVDPLPIVNITSNGKSFKDTLLCNGQPIELSAGFDGISYNWNTGEISESINASPIDQNSNDTSKRYLVTVTNEFGCSASDSIDILRCVVPSSSHIPSAFTPNGDGRNDVWEIPYLQYFSNATVEVYDRWGRLVFHSEKGYHNPWDGRSSGRFVPMDNYFYIIKIDTKSKPIIGSVTVIR